MLQPQVSLWRHRVRVSFYEAGSAFLGGAHQWPFDPASQTVLARRRRWASHEQSVSYLRYWVGDRGALSELAWLLSRGRASSAGPRRSAEDLLFALASRLLAGDLVVVEESSRIAHPSRLALPPASPAAAAASASKPLTSVAAVATPQALLPALEKVSIEGAEVKPELDQSIEQVQLSMQRVAEASASLEPAPSRVGDIQSSLGAAAQRSSTDLEEM